MIKKAIKEAIKRAQCLPSEIVNAFATVVAIQYVEQHFYKYVILGVFYKISAPLPIKAVMPVIIVLAQQVDIKAILKECLMCVIALSPIFSGKHLGNMDWGLIGILKVCRSMIINALTLDPLEGIYIALMVLLYFFRFLQPLIAFPLVYSWLNFTVQNGIIELSIIGISSILLVKDLRSNKRENSNYFLQMVRILLIVNRSNTIKNMIKPLIKDFTSLILVLDRFIIALGFTAVHKSNKVRMSKYFVSVTSTSQKKSGEFKAHRKSCWDSNEDFGEEEAGKNSSYFNQKSEIRIKEC